MPQDGHTGAGRAREQPKGAAIPAQQPSVHRTQWAHLAGAERVQLGQLLLRAKLLNHRQLDEALARQFRWGSRLGDIVLASGWVKPPDRAGILVVAIDRRLQGDLATHHETFLLGEDCAWHQPLHRR